MISLSDFATMRQSFSLVTVGRDKVFLPRIFLLFDKLLHDIKPLKHVHNIFDFVSLDTKVFLQELSTIMLVARFYRSINQDQHVSTITSSMLRNYTGCERWKNMLCAHRRLFSVIGIIRCLFFTFLLQLQNTG